VTGRASGFKKVALVIPIVSPGKMASWTKMVTEMEFVCVVVKISEHLSF